MKKKVLVLAMLAVGTRAQASGDPVADKCVAGKTITAGKYATCVAGAEAILATTGDQATYDVLLAKCSLKLSKPWARFETAAVVGGSSCPSEGDGQAVKDFVDACMQGVADACSGNGLPSYAGCATDLATCQADLGASGASLGACTGTLDTCTSNLNSANTALGTCSSGLSACEGDLSATNADLVTCSNSLDSCQSGTSCQVAVLATGQATSYGPGSDGNLKKGAPRSFTDNGDGTITDNVTGLMWEKKSDDDSVHDKDNAYTWSAGSGSMDGTIVSSFLAEINSGQGFAGYTDWRVPNVVELQSLVNWGATNPAVFTGFNDSCTPGCSVIGCSCTRPEEHWSSTTLNEGSTFAWYMTFANGGVNFGDNGGSANGVKSYAHHVRAVRSGTPLPPRFRDNGDGTITDNKSGLMWEKKSDDGSVHDKDNFYQYSSSGGAPDGSMWTEFLATLNAGGGFAGHTDWRIPNINELLGLIDLAQSPVLIDPIFVSPCNGGGTVSEVSCTELSLWYWSSSDGQYAAEPRGQTVRFSVSDISYQDEAHIKTLYAAVRAVRTRP